MTDKELLAMCWTAFEAIPVAVKARKRGRSTNPTIKMLAY